MNKELAINLLRGFVLGTNEQLHEAVFMAIKALKAEPKHAYAIIDEDGNMKCSNCGSGNCFDNYCGHCGAKIMGERKDDLKVAHCENCKYEDAVGGMTNRQYLATLSNEELANTIYDVIIDRIGWRYTSSKQGVSQWLGELYREDDFKKFTYYTDNKKIMDGGENG